MNQKKLKALFGSGMRVMVLNHYFKNPDGRFYIRELAMIFGKHMNGVRLEILNLEKLGILKRKIENKKTYFRLRESTVSQDLSRVFGYDLFPDKK